MKKILLVEETKPLAKAIVDILKISGYNVQVAENGVQGLEATHSYSPDLVITDVAMPIMDGLEFVTKLRSEKYLKDLPVIILSAKVTPQDVQNGKNAGADVYLKKPCAVDELLTTVAALLEK